MLPVEASAPLQLPLQGLSFAHTVPVHQRRLLLELVALDLERVHRHVRCRKVLRDRAECELGRLAVALRLDQLLTDSLAVQSQAADPEPGGA